MEFTIKPLSPCDTGAECLVLPVAGEKLPAATAEVDAALGGLIGRLVAEGDLAAKAGSTLLVPVSATLAKKILLLQFGKEKEFKVKTVRDTLRAAAKAALGANAASVALCLDGLKKVDAEAAAGDFAQALVTEGYRFDRLKKKPEPACKLLHVTLALGKKDDVAKVEAALAKGLAVGHGVNFARDLGNLPGNLCTPLHLAEAAESMAREFGFKCQVLDEQAIASQGMTSFLSVAKGSDVPPRLIVLEYKGGKGKPVALVGKGLTFDAGGISLKPGEGMDEMKYDMCGGAAVLGTFRAIAELGLPVNVVGVIPACENMPSGRANKPGDVIATMDGQTVEILNTDAEGRLILCDALTYTARFEPEVVVDLATLTGACVIALGHVTNGLFANDDELADELLAAADKSGDLTWRLPLFEEYQEQLKSNFADMANIGGRPAGAITAACFLSRFAEKYRWAHLDIAGTAWKSGAAKGATGRPVPLLVEFLTKRAKKK
ncbi:leucyl aminopeptidase [Formivibrio citricus]|uniref:Probable cytosol aminopeptidase n=1 Tax=Formivibrio citricus TaxID=83765 RepID=A0A1I5CC17_9NEIS|nr:leucyl aminopeptidase [Formivibrio citricus]SFN84548.1 leucyl aminopeptidase [Formivibrio citricus]